MVKKTVPTESFFNFFSPPKAPSDEDDDISSDIEERLELDYQLGEDIKEKLIPRAIDWFTGEALQFEQIDDYDEGEFEDEDDEEEDDLSDDRDEDDESDEEVSRIRQAESQQKQPKKLTKHPGRWLKAEAGGCRVQAKLKVERLESARQ